EHVVGKIMKVHRGRGDRRRPAQSFQSGQRVRHGSERYGRHEQYERHSDRDLDEGWLSCQPCIELHTCDLFECASLAFERLARRNPLGVSPKKRLNKVVKWL